MMKLFKKFTILMIAAILFCLTAVYAPSDLLPVPAITVAEEANEASEVQVIQVAADDDDETPDKKQL